MAEIEDAASSTAVDGNQRRADVVQSYPGQALTLAEADSLARRCALKVIVLAGPPAAGKTTLLAGIYEAFRTGPLAGLLFAGSRSLIGFEERCHLSRLASGLLVPDTYHTPVDDPTSLVHVRLRRDDLAEPAFDLLFADLSGEHFLTLRDTGNAGRARSLFQTAADVAFLLDGSRLADSRERFACLEDTKTLLRVCRERELLPPLTRIQIVVTKWDWVLGSEDGRRLWIEQVLEEVARSAPSRQVTPTLYRTALRSGNGIRRGFGVDELLRTWASARVPRRYVEPQPPQKPSRQSFMFGRQI